MNNKEVIERLNLMQERCCNGYDAEAINLAIKALANKRPQTISCFNCKHDYKSAADEPCKYCEKHCEWQAKGGRE